MELYGVRQLADQAPVEKSTATPMEKVKATLPAPLVALATGANGLVRAVAADLGAAGSADATILWLRWGVWALVLALAIYSYVRAETIKRAEGKGSISQLVITLVTFVFWSLALDGLFRETVGTPASIDNLVLGLWTLVVAFIFQGR